ncbi:MAG: polysaccharide biosynthesis tyrosine autokinase [Dehalococcoidia bacterium]
MELGRYILIIRRWLWLIAATTVIAGGVAYLVSSHQTKMYRATASLIVNQGQAAAGTSYNDILANQQLTKTYVSIATYWPVMETAAKSLGIDSSRVPSSCACIVNDRGATLLSVTADVPLNTEIVNISGVSSSPSFAADGANAVAAAFTETIKQSQLLDTGAAEKGLQDQIKQVQDGIDKTTSDIRSAQSRGGSGGSPADIQALQTQLSQQQATLGTLNGQLGQIRLEQAKAVNAVKLVAPARLPTAPFSPRTLLTSLIAALLGLFASAGVAILMEYLDDRVQTPADVERASEGVSTLGIVELLGKKRGNTEGLNGEMLLQPSSHPTRMLEAYRVLRSNLEFASAGRKVLTIAVTSARPGEGKTTTAANLAIVLGQTGKRVLLVDADLRRPTLHKRFDVANGAGLSTLFLMEDPAVVALTNVTGYENLHLLTTGPLPPNPTELLSSPRMRQLMELLSEQFEVVIVDTPPLLAVADASEIAARVDGVLMVVDTAKTRPAELAHAKESLDRASAMLLGVVLNKLQRRQTTRSDYYYDYYYSYGYHGEHSTNAAIERSPSGKSVKEKQAVAVSVADDVLPQTKKPSVNGRHQGDS